MRPCSALLWLLLLTSSTAPADPTWWEARGVKSTAPAANLAPATIGQAKHMAAMALAELAGHLDAPAFQALQTDLAAIVNLTLPNPLPSDFYEQQRAVLLTGQLKAIAKPFYDHLRTHDAAWLDNAMTSGNLFVMEPGSDPPSPSPYPWSEATTDDANRAPATLGQLKAVFSLPLETLPGIPITPDTDGDGMSDAWEIQNGFNPNNSDDATGDADDDGINNLMEFNSGLSPHSVDIVGPVNLGFDIALPKDPGPGGPDMSFRDLHPSDLYCEDDVPGWDAASGGFVEVWDEGNGNPYAELQSHKGAHGITQEFYMLPGTSVSFILSYKGRYDFWDGVINNAFTLKVEGASELVVDGMSISEIDYVRSKPFMQSDTGNQWESWHNATVTITAPEHANYLMPIALSLVPNETISGGCHITYGGFVDITPECDVRFKSMDGTFKDKLIVPIAESGGFKKIGQEIQLYVDATPEFDGKVTITNKNPDKISLWKSKDGDNDPLGVSFTIDIRDGRFATPRNFFVKGISEITDAEIEAVLVKENAPQGPPIDPAILKVDVPVVGLQEILFSGDANAYIPLTTDNETPFPGSTTIPGTTTEVPNPHWQDSNGDGTPEVNYSIAYVKSSTPKIAPKIKLNNAAAYTGTAKLSVTGSGTAGTVKFLNQLMATDSSNPNAAIISPAAPSPTPVAAGNWPGTIMFYGKSSPAGSDRPAFELSWKISIDGGHEVEFAKSKHQAYITLNKPNQQGIKSNSESLFYWACDGAMGRNDSSIETVNAIFDKHFSLDNTVTNDKEIHRIDPTTGNEAEDKLEYIDSRKGLFVDNGTMCGGWATAFSRVISVHSISILVVKLGVMPDATGSNPGRMWVREQVKDSPSGYKKAPGKVIASGQGSSQHTGSWGNHVICKKGDAYFDPAYGIRADTDVKYEYKAFQGFTINKNDARKNKPPKTIDTTPSGPPRITYQPATQEEYNLEEYNFKFFE